MDILIKNNLISIFPKPADLFQAAVEDFTKKAIAAVAAKGWFTVVLSGGNTVKFFFNALTQSALSTQEIPWRQIKFFFGDERYVPADNEENNYHTAKEYLFSKVSVPAENVYPIPTELADSHLAADHYEKTLRRVLNLKNDEFPQFDLVYLGLGDNAHTASLMPFSDVVMSYAKNLDLDKNNQLVASLWVPELKMYRITLTPPAINHSSCVCFLVMGASKAPAVQQILEGPFNPVQYPAQLIQCADGKIIWYLDQAAAEQLALI